MYSYTNNRLVGGAQFFWGSHPGKQPVAMGINETLLLSFSWGLKSPMHFACWAHRSWRFMWQWWDIKGQGCWLVRRFGQRKKWGDSSWVWFTKDRPKCSQIAKLPPNLNCALCRVWFSFWRNDCPFGRSAHVQKSARAVTLEIAWIWFQQFQQSHFNKFDFLQFQIFSPKQETIEQC